MHSLKWQVCKCYAFIHVYICIHVHRQLISLILTNIIHKVIITRTVNKCICTCILYIRVYEFMYVCFVCSVYVRMYVCQLIKFELCNTKILGSGRVFRQQRTGRAWLFALAPATASATLSLQAQGAGRAKRGSGISAITCHRLNGPTLLVV